MFLLNHLISLNCVIVDYFKLLDCYYLFATIIIIVSVIIMFLFPFFIWYYFYSHFSNSNWLCVVFADLYHICNILFIIIITVIFSARSPEPQVYG